MAITGAGHGVVKFTTNGTLAGRRQVGYVRWVGATAAGHHAYLRDSASNLWFESEADGANFVDLFPVWREVNGLQVAMSSGTFYVYVR